MKAKDITTPADYEVRPWKGGEHKARIVRVEKKTVNVMPAGSYQSHATEAWRAISEYEDNDGKTREHDWTLAQVIRPWADASVERDAAERSRLEGRRVRSLLTETLSASGIKANVTGTDRLSVTLSQADAERLADLLLGNGGE